MGVGAGVGACTVTAALVACAAPMTDELPAAAAAAARFAVNEPEDTAVVSSACMDAVTSLADASDAKLDVLREMAKLIATASVLANNRRVRRRAASSAQLVAPMLCSETDLRLAASAVMSSASSVAPYSAQLSPARLRVACETKNVEAVGAGASALVGSGVVVGTSVGAPTGAADVLGAAVDGCAVGLDAGTTVGGDVGAGVGPCVGEGVGGYDGNGVGIGDGLDVGIGEMGVGSEVGGSVGVGVGTPDGDEDGGAVGGADGMGNGTADGCGDGAGLGIGDGAALGGVEGDGVGAVVGVCVGAGVGAKVFTSTPVTSADDISSRRPMNE